MPDPRLDRRRFLALAGGAAAYLALRPHAAWARRAAALELQPWRLPHDPPADPVELVRALIGAAILAPNHWNSQPWRFEVEPGSIRLVADTRRSLPASDPDQRAMTVSLGAALENLVIAARAYGLRPQVATFPQPATPQLAALITWAHHDVRRDRALFEAIPLRRTNRRDYDGRGIFPQNRIQLLAQAPDGVRIHWLDGRAAIRRAADLAFEATRARLADRRVAAERYAWMRFSDGDARRRGDGVSVESLELGGPARWIARRYFDPRSAFHRLGVESAAKQARDRMRSAGALALIATPRRGEAAWLAAGQAYERFALEATRLGIAHQPINDPLAMDRTRAAVIEAFDAAGAEPLMLVRLGHASRPRPTARRAVALVASFRNS